MFTPLHRNRDFMLLWCGQVASAVGSAVSSVAFPLLVLAMTHSPAQAGFVGFAGTLPFLSSSCLTADWSIAGTASAP